MTSLMSAVQHEAVKAQVGLWGGMCILDGEAEEGP